MTMRFATGMAGLLALTLLFSPSVSAGTSSTATPGKGSQGTTRPDKDDLDEYSSTADIADPIQPVNRGVFWFNHQLYHYVGQPLTKVYQTVFPQPVRTGIFNVFDNLEYPDRFVNDLLQARFRRAGQETGKFVVNSTAGVGGIFKVSQKIPWMADVPAEDTGLTLGRWGIGHGPYVVLPVLGPKSLRDTVGTAGDYALSPTAWFIIWFPGAIWTPAVTSPDTARNVEKRMTAYDTVTHDTLDRYLAVRTTYAQSRKQAASR
jgi:phospholipid-binding lipoprotein MlaA